MSDQEYSPQTTAENDRPEAAPNMPGDAPTSLPGASSEMTGDSRFDAPVPSPNPAPEMPGDVPSNPASSEPDPYVERLERLGGEPAPVITPEEFARLQRAGEVHIDERGRVRATRRPDAEAGVSLRKRRAWYSIGMNLNDLHGIKKGYGD